MNSPVINQHIVHFKVRSFTIFNLKKIRKIKQKILISLVNMLWFNFIVGSIFIFLVFFFFFFVIIIHDHAQKQRKIKIEPREKVNHNKYIVFTIINCKYVNLIASVIIVTFISY